MTDLLQFRDASSMRKYSRQQRLAGKRIALVPTMGYLHAGHLSLVQAAKDRADIVIASIYVNPTQFSKNEDFGVYPKAREEDHRKLLEMGCAAVFEPLSLYHPGSGSTEGKGDASNVVGAGEHIAGAHETFIEVQQLQKGLCGVSRPHFFRGVATIVAKLFNIVEPDVAVFGKKDYQQWRVICRMVRDLDFDIEIVGVATGREADGMAMSSRNALLTPENRQKAVCISQALKWADGQIAQGCVSPSDIQQEVKARVQQAGGRVDYVSVTDAENLQELMQFEAGQEVLVALAVFFGSVRLIDNVVAVKK
ncbi:hypothetical protein ABBQ38_007551 [Trebouxia sp. C0009 RCD-2024]